MPPQTVLSPTALALVLRVYGELPPLDPAGQWEVSQLCTQRLADRREMLNAHQVAELLGCKLTKVGDLRRTGLLPSSKSGTSVQSARRFPRDGMLLYQLGCVVRAHRIAPLAAE
jgi:hypothetical protein